MPMSVSDNGDHGAGIAFVAPECVTDAVTKLLPLSVVRVASPVWVPVTALSSAARATGVARAPASQVVGRPLSSQPVDAPAGT